MPNHTNTSKDQTVTNLSALKQMPPVIHPHDIYRMRLMQVLNGAMNKQLILLIAPDGYGKTTLLGQWASQPHIKNAWLTLDTGDNDPAYFFRHFVSTLQAIKKNIGQDAFTMLQSQEGSSMEKVLLRLIQDIGMVLQDFVVILDDYHKIRSQPIHNMISFLLENQPPQMHLVLASQLDPPIELAKLRSAGKVQELRKPHLAFSIDDAKALLNEAMDLKIAHGDVSAIVVRAQSQPAAIRYAGLCLQNIKKKAEFVTKFEKEEQDTFLFLVETLLSQQPDAVQSFLKQISILDYFAPGLCQAVSGDEKSGAFLTELAKKGCFIRQLDITGKWYRYESFLLENRETYFAGILEEKQINLNLRASLWFTQNKLIPRAFRHAVAARNMDLAGQFIEENAMEMLKKGELVTVLSWLNKMPSRVFDARPMLSICQAWIAIISNQLQDIEKHLHRAEKALSTAKNQEEAGGHIQAIRDFLAAR